MTTSLSPEQLQPVCTALSSAALIRLISEIDDNGSIPSRGLARTLSDLTPHQIRHATEQAHALGLVHARRGASLGLTESGADLADVYDATARWARRHEYPARSGDFTGRIRHTLALLAEPQVFAALAAAQAPSHLAAAGRLSTAKAAAELVQPWNALAQWLDANPQAVEIAEGELAA
ncbi:hypothetical protein ACFXOM_33955 [Streptomyces sp. NPDC059169]|uniref:hypothetical protein n=1 Tax=Streptomyces sp. NPDC059169 TaxID=3346754 RepID=UPI0036C79254